MKACDICVIGSYAVVDNFMSTKREEVIFHPTFVASVTSQYHTYNCCLVFHSV